MVTVGTGNACCSPRRFGGSTTPPVLHARAAAPIACDTIPGRPVERGLDADSHPCKGVHPHDRRGRATRIGLRPRCPRLHQLPSTTTHRTEPWPVSLHHG